MWSRGQTGHAWIGDEVESKSQGVSLLSHNQFKEFRSSVLIFEDI